MIRFLVPLALVAMAACAPEPPPPSAFRPAAAAIYSNAVYDPARLAGDWVQVAAFAAPGAAACARGRMQVSGAGASLTHQAALCLNGQSLSSSGALRPVGPEILLQPGQVEVVSPTLGDVHRVRNAFDDRVSISIHVYGGNIGTIRRSVFAPDGTVKEFVSGYANARPPELWRG